ncbi:hypothetical protein [Candidatus Liberibacter sp.]|uniref:hypothetical protein n=1 Tax=Candidatus Liberibacter sp. TaxID=34022 RepID=UPI0015F5E3A0|nr:hypothetical protein [Candidatus Liberibacter sp.]MBA5724263.1 hypothetical protein [Candidatus Liberibacter sp.]
MSIAHLRLLIRLNGGASNGMDCFDHKYCSQRSRDRSAQDIYDPAQKDSPFI